MYAHSLSNSCNTGCRNHLQWSFYSLQLLLFAIIEFFYAYRVFSSSYISMIPTDSQVVGESERSREQILQTLNDLSRGFQDIADRCLLVLHLEVRYAGETAQLFTGGIYTFRDVLCCPDLMALLYAVIWQNSAYLNILFIQIFLQYLFNIKKLVIIVDPLFR